MEEEMMEDMVEYTFTVLEIDLDYEYDAPRYFDFSHDESLPETRQAESWFESAGSYPPSPFVTRLILKEDDLLESINVSPKTKVDENMSLSDSDSDIEVEQGVPGAIKEGEGNNAGHSVNLEISNAEKLLNQLRQLPSGLTFHNHMAKDTAKDQTRCPGKPSCPRTSTLMKPTASHLAKQNPLRPVGESRLTTFLVEKNGTSSAVVETQAAKRQKLESGHLRKVAEAKPVFSFVHKAPKRDGKVDGNNTLAKPRITIPREPELQTTHRAQRARPKGSEQAENLAPTAIRRFKALPLNKKILEGPSMPPKRSNPRLPQFQEFHLKTSERAVQHRSAVSTSAANSSTSNKVLQKPSNNSTMECGNREFRRDNHVEAPKQEESTSTYNFKALPLNKKILSSKGDIGVFRNTKRETTVPMEFNFHTEKRIHHNPPIDLFNKLSLTSEPQPAGVQLKAQRPSFFPSKGSKENRWAYFQQNHEIVHTEKGKLADLKSKANSVW
ncbi:protein TPX2-like isoform X1 [Nicotiana tabacum]|uniref:Protein TPX2-like isoform X1 n=2 Tax=Nicotiana tabacum TaxID=4097 RepID=A0A1S4BLF8_TOBAC|nr:PREDICTED: protein TPX2-like isoform X1 [Nicotiana tabacum]XP_016489667.1 PREDICTED: protein TPX2-like isoform X1 [Nicotiana tabacum]